MGLVNVSEGGALRIILFFSKHYLFYNHHYNQQKQSIFGEVCDALHIFCMLPVTVTGGELSVNPIKTCLSSTWSQDRYFSWLYFV